MPTYDTTSPEYIQAKQERLEELGAEVYSLDFYRRYSTISKIVDYV